MKTETISYLKKNAANLELDEPMCVTQNGKPAYIIESYESRKRLDESIALLKLVSLSAMDVKAGRVMSSDALKEKLTERKKAAKGCDSE